MKRDEFLKAFDADAQPAPGSVTATYKKTAQSVLEEASGPHAAQRDGEFDGDTKEAPTPVSVSGMAKRIAEERKAAAAGTSAWSGSHKGGKIAMTPDGPVIKFGVHRGKLMRDVPSDYLRWILKQDFNSDTIEAVKRELGSR